MDRVTRHEPGHTGSPDLVDEALTAIVEETARDQVAVQRASRRRSRWPAAIVLVSCCVLLTAYTAGHLLYDSEAPPPISRDPRHVMLLAVEVAAEEAQGVHAESGAYPEQLEFLEGLEEDGWSYERPEPGRFRVSWTQSAWTVTYDSSVNDFFIDQAPGAGS